MCRLHKSLVICLGLTLIVGTVSRTPVLAGIPEPGIVLYGQVVDGTGALVTSGELVLTYTGSGGGDPVTVSVQLTRIEAPGGPFCYKALIPLETAIPGYPSSANAIPLIATPVEYTRSAIVPEKNISITDTVIISTADRGTVRLLSLGVASLDDADQDGLPDTWEKQIMDADPNDAIASVNDVSPEDDFDGDGESNSMEYLNNTDPTDPMSARLGDIDGDGYISLNDTILVLKLISGIEPTPNVSADGDVNGDGRIGLEEAFYVIQKLSGIK